MKNDIQAIFKIITHEKQNIILPIIRGKGHVMHYASKDKRKHDKKKKKRDHRDSTPYRVLWGRSAPE